MHGDILGLVVTSQSHGWSADRLRTINERARMNDRAHGQTSKQGEKKVLASGDYRNDYVGRIFLHK